MSEQKNRDNMYVTHNQHPQVGVIRPRRSPYRDYAGPTHSDDFASRQLSPSHSQEDLGLQAKVLERIHQQGQVDSTAIHVDVQNGRVTLRGDIGSQFLKRLVEDTVGQCSGVTSVSNHLQVQAT